MIEKIMITMGMLSPFVRMSLKSTKVPGTKAPESEKAKGSAPFAEAPGAYGAFQMSSVNPASPAR
jgi:hypothetical protein